MTCIIIFPLVMNRPYEVTTQGSIYTENAIEYNDLYLNLFGFGGSAGDGDFLLFCHYEVTSDALGIITMDVLQDSVTVDVVAVFVIGDELELLDSRPDSSDAYIFSFVIMKGVTYGVAVFGHKEASNIDVEIGFTVVIQI